MTANIKLGAPSGGSVQLTPTDTSGNYTVSLPATTDTLLVRGDGAANAVYTPAGGAAVTTTVQAKLRESVSVKDFGAVGDGVTDDTAAIQAAVTMINALGGGILLFPPATYKIGLSNGAVAAAFSNLDGITISASGAIIDDATVYGSAEIATLFQFTACKNIRIPRGLRVQSQREDIAYNTDLGLVAVKLLQGCDGFDISLELDGCHIGVTPYKESSDADSYSSRNGLVNIRATRTHYPYFGRFAGDGVRVNIDATDCGRNFYVFGVKKNHLSVRSKNQKVTSLITAYEGYGCDDVTVVYYDRESTDCNASAPCISLMWGDSTAATHQKIGLDVNLKIPAGDPWGDALTWVKYSTGTTPDSTGRGHILDGFNVTGIIDHTGTVKSHFAMSSGAFATSGTPDVQRNIDIGNLELISGASWNMPLPALDGTAYAHNVKCGVGFYMANSGGGQVVFTACRAVNFTSATTHTYRHTYIGCAITTGDLQNVYDSKSFLDCDYAGRLLNSVPNIGANSGTNTKVISADLTGPTNVFLVKLLSGTLATFRLKYILSSDTAGTNVTTGVKTFTASMDSSGVWTSLIAVADDVTERTKGTASVVTVSLVNGTSSGGYVAIACTNYNTANARAGLVLEAVGRFGPVMVASV